jgi:hypothetical protein
MDTYDLNSVSVGGDMQPQILKDFGAWLGQSPHYLFIIALIIVLVLLVVYFSGLLTTMGLKQSFSANANMGSVSQDQAGVGSTATGALSQPILSYTPGQILSSSEFNCANAGPTPNNAWAWMVKNIGPADSTSTPGDSAFVSTGATATSATAAASTTPSGTTSGAESFISDNILSHAMSGGHVTKH